MTDRSPRPKDQQTHAPSGAPGSWPIDVDPLIDPEIEVAIAGLDRPATLLGGMARYHLGQLESDLSPVPDAGRRAINGKRLRPVIALLCCAAQGGDPGRAAPVAAAIELLHNFTLVHDDIQDESDTRRHRPTVWSLWGRSQAINAGDALFAAAHLALYRSRIVGVADDLALRLSEAFAQTAIEIVQGQVLDLDFEGRDGVTTAAYLEMIERKTAAIVRYAAWAGALIGGADELQATRFGAFGRSLGLGFQVRDDLLGIWGATEATGKPRVDDIRRRKQSLPILILRERANPSERTELDRLYSQPTVDDAGVDRVLDLLETYEVRDSVERRIAALHGDAKTALNETGESRTRAAMALHALVDTLATRMR